MKTNTPKSNNQSSAEPDASGMHVTKNSKVDSPKFGDTDGLTLLFNRTHGVNLIEQRLVSADFSQGLFILMDLDHFKEVNDILGHQKGDSLLIDVATTLSDFFKDEAVLFRLGGDEFVAFWENPMSLEEKLSKLQNLLGLMNMSIVGKNTTLSITISMGCAFAPEYGISFAELYKKADQALYHSKSRGRNRITLFSQDLLEEFAKNELFHLSAYDYENILNSIKIASIFVITESDHKVLYFNEKAAQTLPGIKIGASCHDYRFGLCENCPIFHIGTSDFAHTIKFSDDTGEEIEMTASRVKWHGKIPAFLIQVHPLIQSTTLTQRSQGLQNPIALLPVTENAQPLPKVENGDHQVILGEYSESMYYLDDSTTISDLEQSIIDSLLIKNQAVGIVAGYFDEAFTIRFMSQIAMNALGYESNFDLFFADSGSTLLARAATEEERDYLKTKLSSPSIGTWSFNFLGANNTIIPFWVQNDIATAPNGKKMWYFSVRRANEMQYDYLTGGHNRSSFVHMMHQMIHQGVNMQDYTFLHIDIKDFKMINELFGTLGGDHLLKAFYNHLLASPLTPVLCGRSDADHFGVLVKNENLDLDILPEILKFNWFFRNKYHLVHSVCGICPIDEPAPNIDHLLHDALLATENESDVRSKPYVVFQPYMRNNYIGQRDVLSNFDDALTAEEFVVYYQPIVDCITGEVISAEALARWITKDNRIVPPGMFLPILENTASITKLDRYIFEKVRKYLAYRKLAGLQLIPISVNLSRMDFFDDDMVELISRSIKTDPLIANYIRFEITETAYHSITERQNEFIRMISDLGGMVYIDDFGVANSSTDMLLQHDFSVLKLDMKFVHQIETNPRSTSIIKSVIHLAHGLSMKVVAEGVERIEQFEFLKKVGCDYVQGFLFSKPLPQEDFDEYLKNHIS